MEITQANINEYYHMVQNQISKINKIPKSIMGPKPI